MRILMLSQWFTPEPNLVLPLAKGLMGLGHEVQVLTGFPNYPGGKVYPGYRVRPWQREVIEGLPVLRVALYPSHDASAWKRVANYVSFAASSSTVGLALTGPVDAVYVYHPPLTVGLPALWFRWLRGVPFVFHIQDLWPETLTATGMLNNGSALKAVGKFSQWVYHYADRLVAISPGFKEALVQRGVPEDKVEVIYNWCDEASLGCPVSDPALAQKTGMAGRFNILFAGTMGLAQGLDSVLEAAALVKMRCPAVHFVFVGGGVEVEKLKRMAREKALDNVLFLERRPPSEIGGIIALADVLLVHLKDDPLFRITIPGKTQAYLWSGKPILMGVRGDAADLVERAGAGISCAPENPSSIAEVVEKFYRMSRPELDAMGKRGRWFYEQELSLQVTAKHFDRIFQAVCHKG
jgi:glycosyltransferase involved in cell wall biosynthesis